MRICTTDGCNNESIFDTNVCDDCLNAIYKKNLENFGTPDYFLCGNCGIKVSTEKEFVEHVKDKH